MHAGMNVGLRFLRHSRSCVKVNNISICFITINWDTLFL